MSKTTITVKSTLRQSHWRAGIQFAPGVQTVDVSAEQHKLIQADPHLKISGRAAAAAEPDQNAGNKTAEQLQAEAVQETVTQLLGAGVADLKASLPRINDKTVLDAALAAEKQAAQRTTAIAAIEARIAELGAE